MNTENTAGNILLTGGRAPVTLDLARKLHSCGLKVYVAESLPAHLCKYSRAVKENFYLPSPKFSTTQYIEKLKTIIGNYKINFLIPTCEEIFYISRYKQNLTAAYPEVNIFADSFDKLKMLHSKWDFIEYIRRLDKPVPRTWLLTSPTNIADFAAKAQISERLILKPVFSRFAAKVIELKNGESIPPLDVSAEYPWIAQEFMIGRQYCSYSICHNGNVAAHAAYCANFTAGRGACVCFEHVSHQGIYQWVKDIVKNINFTGQIAFDFVETAEKILYPLECNPRATSGIHLLNACQLKKAITIPSTVAQPSWEKPKMLAAAMLLYGLRQCKDYLDWKRWLKAFWHSQDVVFSLDDPLPFFQQFVMLKALYFMRGKMGISLIETTTHDIEWDGEGL